MSQAQKDMFREQELNEIGKAIPKTDGECLGEIMHMFLKTEDYPSLLRKKLKRWLENI